MRRPLALLVPLVVLVACGDDDAASDDTTTTTTSTTTVVEATAPAEEVPSEDAGPDEGLGDAVLAGDLDGAGVVPGPGAPAGSGRVEAELVEGTLCVDMEVAGLDDEVTEAHLHSGRAGEDGPVLVDVGPPSSADDGASTWDGVCTGVDDDVIEDLATAPELAYVDVHSASFPDGAVRGQLGVISIFDRTLD